ncbi:MAG: ABC transporter permease [Eubacteriales bacterium]|nr:ABC transporter permease [Eubacteriales bacterium]
MRKLFAVDLKRLLQNRSAIIIAVAAPLLLVLLISFAVAPYFFADVRTEIFSVAVFNEDDDPLTVSILQGLTESETLGGLIETRFVGSEQEGMEAVEEGAAAYIHIPKDMQQTLQSGGTVSITYYGNPDMPLEDALLFETLLSGTELVSHAQHAVNMLDADSREAGVEQETAAAMYKQTTGMFFSSVLSRSALYEETDTTSPLGGALPIEYYAASFLILFTALGAMPIARITADDYATGLIHRQLLSGHTPATCFISRWLAGSLFLFIQFAVLTAALCVIAGAASAFSGNVLVLLAGGILLCGFLSLGMMLAGLFSKTSAVAVRAAFLSAVALALLGGLLVPSAYMPAFIRDVSYYTPFSAALRLGVSGMFDGRAGGTGVFAATLFAYLAVMLPLSIKRFQRRTK